METAVLMARIPGTGIPGALVALRAMQYHEAAADNTRHFRKGALFPG